MLVSCQDCDTYVWGVSLIVVTETNPTKIKEEGGEKLLRTWPVHVVSKAFFISNQIILTYFIRGSITVQLYVLFYLLMLNQQQIYLFWTNPNQSQWILTYLWLWLSCGRAVAFDTRGLQFKILYWTLIYSQWQLYWKTKTKYKIGREWPFLKKTKSEFLSRFFEHFSILRSHQSIRARSRKKVS